MPLDGQIGYETVFAHGTERPTDNLASFVDRMEGVSGDPDSVTRVVAGAFPAAVAAKLAHALVVASARLFGDYLEAVELGAYRSSQSKRPMSVSIEAV